MARWHNGQSTTAVQSQTITNVNSNNGFLLERNTGMTEDGMTYLFTSADDNNVDDDMMMMMMMMCPHVSS